MQGPIKSSTNPEYLNKGMKKPEKGGKPKKIETKNPPGGPHTPGEKGTYKK